MTIAAARPSQKLPAPLIAVVVLLGISVFINYIDRGNLSIAAPMLKDELGISPVRLGILFSAFFWTYACLQPVTGWLVDRFDVNWVMAIGFFLWSSATAVTGFVHTFTTLLMIRLFLGIGESVAFPSYSKIIALNIPEEHRGLANSAVTAGLAAGPGVGMLLGGTLMTRLGWRPFFILFGLVSLLWLLPWMKYMPRSANPDARQHSASSYLQGIHLPALGLGNMRRTVLLQLPELLSHHLAAVLPDARASFLHGQDGRHRWNGIPAGGCFRNRGRLAFGPLDHRGSDAHESPQNLYRRRSSPGRNVPGADCH